MQVIQVEHNDGGENVVSRRDGQRVDIGALKSAGEAEKHVVPGDQGRLGFGFRHLDHDPEVIRGA